MRGPLVGLSGSRIVSRDSTIHPAERKDLGRDDDHRCRPTQEHAHGDSSRPADKPDSGVGPHRSQPRRLPPAAEVGGAVRSATVGNRNAECLGRHLSSWRLARGEDVVDVSSAATARVRQLSRGGGRKNDQIDAAAAACAAALQGDSRPLQAEDLTDALALLDESRTNLAQSRVRLVNQLHALLRDLLAGGAPTDLSATTAAALLRRVRPSGDAEQVRKQIATDLVSQIRSVDSLLKANAKQISKLVAASGSTLTGIVGIGAITAGRLIGRTGRAARFPTAAAFANYAGAAPVEVASADKARHRLSRSGDRQLNAALHTAAITQIRTPGSRGHSYYNAKLRVKLPAKRD